MQLEQRKVVTYRHTVNSQSVKNAKLIEEVWERIFNVYYIGRYKGNYRFQILTLKLNYSSSVPMPYVYFQKRMASVFDTLSILVSSEGEIKQINNLENVIAKAEKVIKELSVDHRGSYFEVKTAHFMHTLNNLTSLIEYLNQYNMFGLLFHKDVWNKNVLINSLKENVNRSEEDKWEVLDISKEDEMYNGKVYYKGDDFYEVNVEHTEKQLITKYNLLWIG